MPGAEGVAPRRKIRGRQLLDLSAWFRAAQATADTRPMRTYQTQAARSRLWSRRSETTGESRASRSERIERNEKERERERESRTLGYLAFTSAIHFARRVLQSLFFTFRCLHPCTSARARVRRTLAQSHDTRATHTTRGDT